MPRQRIKGRSRPVTPASRLQRQLELVNTKLNRLDRSGSYGSYASKKLLKRVIGQRGIKYNRGKKQKITIDLKNLNISQMRYYSKLFDEFNRSKTSSVIGIEDVREQTRESLKQTLGQITDLDINDQDVDDFYSLVADEDFRYLADKTGDSEMYILIQTAKEKGWGKEKFVTTIGQYLKVNNKQARDKAGRLYDKYVMGI